MWQRASRASEKTGRTQFVPPLKCRVFSGNSHVSFTEAREDMYKSWGKESMIKAVIEEGLSIRKAAMRYNNYTKKYTRRSYQWQSFDRYDKWATNTTHTKGRKCSFCIIAPILDSVKLERNLVDRFCNVVAFETL